MSSTASPESREIWTKSQVYQNSFLIPEDEAAAFEKIAANTEANGLRNIAVTLAQGKFLNLLARSIGAKKILEVGTLGG
jgi:predicted O-methyltransferase YrrM